MITNFGNHESELYKSLSAPTYSIADASRLTGIGKWSVSRWLRGYKYEGGEQGPVIRRSIPPQSTYASFLDLIDLLFVKRFIERGIPLQRIRKAADEAIGYTGTPHFARSTFFTSNRNIILKLISGDMVALLRHGQRAMGEIIEKVYDKLDFEEVTEYGFARRWYPNGKDGHIVIDPLISFGRPTLLGYGVATNNIFDLYLGEDKKIEPVGEWFNIPVPKIQAAVHFEHSLWT